MEHKQIVIVGLGSCGIRSICALARRRLKGCELVAADNEMMPTGYVKSVKKIFLPNPKEDLRQISEKLTKLDFVFILNGAGGETGSSSALMLAKMAKERKARVISIMTRPFTLERKRYGKADGFITDMRKVADETIIRDNNSAVKHMPDKQMLEVFEFMEKSLYESIKAFADSEETKAGPFFTDWMYED